MFSKIYKIFLAISLVLIILRVFYFQIIKGDYYREMSLNNYLRVLPLSGYRGNILDRYGRELAGNRLNFSIQVLPDRIKNRSEIFEIINREFDIDIEDLKNIYKLKFKAPFAPLTLVSNVDFERALFLKEKYRNISGLLISENIKRYYSNGTVASHLLGYLGEISEDELKELKPYGYRFSSYIGKSGAEKEFEPYLKGSDGGMLVKVDNQGRIIEILSREEPKRGLDIYLTIDLDLQQKAEELLSPYTGCFLAMDVDSGEIIAAVSSPNFDPNVFISSDNHKILQLLSSREKPLLNRAIQGEYPLGSVFKLLIAVAALDSDVISSGDKFFCPGHFIYGGRSYKCWNSSGHDWQDLRQAIAHSCNVYFYNIGLKTGVDSIVYHADLFGFGQKTGIDLPYEKDGLLPSSNWKAKKIKEHWYPGDTINISIGQGYLLASPMQVIRFMAALANEGTLLKPKVCSSISGELVDKEESENIPISVRDIKFIKRAMRDTVNSPTGTGQIAKVVPAIAGKTGTAQVTSGKPHAWFAGFAPYDSPRIAFLAFVEHGGGGGYATARITKEFLKYYYKKSEL
ncbi:MAG: penicillin-binding protein 2 [Candidatus Kaelpia aquatica]|nr:penicillin-binding protein 2 [Candidatus Kaelpia aquatica]